MIKEDKALKLANIPRNHSVSVLFQQLRYLDNMNDSEFHKELIGTIKNNDDLQKYFLASGEIGQHLQDEIDLQDIDHKLNDGHVRNLLDPLYKNILQRKNMYEFAFKTISKFGKHNPTICSLLGEIEGEKSTDESIKKFLGSMLSVKNLEIKKCLEILKESNRIKELKSQNNQEILVMKMIMIVG